MQLRYLKTLVNAQNAAAKVTAFAWSPNNCKLAVVTVDNVVLLFDDQGEKRDKFSTKASDPKNVKKNYQVKALAFSPDSTKIAVGQTDNIVFIYKIGEDWGERKTICNKFIQQAAVTSIIWPSDQPAFIVGLADGKVRLCNVRTNKSQAIYGTESCVVALAANPSGKGIISGHSDGAIVRFFFDDEGTGLSQGQIVKHSCAPYALAWGATICAAGVDKRIIMYNNDGRIQQQFDYSRDLDEKEFTVASCSPSGHSLVLGSFNRLRVFNWAPRKSIWEEGLPKNIPNLYTITALSWKRDGSRLICGTLCGAVDLFDCCLRRTIYKNKFEMTYVGLSQVIVKNLHTGTRVVVKSHYAYEIQKVNIMGKDRYIVAYTSDTLLLGDLKTFRISEIAWSATGGNEKFFFEHNNICMIFNAGELTLVEYGTNDILGSVRTEFMSPHLISVRINERKQRGVEDNKKIAYLLDLKTISIVDLIFGITLATVAHDTKIDWVELNETSRKLLFRDKKLRLHLYDVESQSRTTLLNYCSYVQWVPMSDVCVAQNRNNLCVWYNIDCPERVTMVTIKGDIEEIERAEGKTEVVVNEGVTTISYTLDEGLIEFGTAIDDGDYNRAVLYLESLEMSPETEAMWKTLSQLALDAEQLHIAERCYAALGNVSRARYLRNVKKVAQSGDEGFRVKAKLAVLDKQFKVAESVYLEQGYVDDAMEMYQELHKWQDALSVAEAKNHPELELLRKNYFQHLTDTGQEEQAGELLEKERDYIGALNMYMKAGLPAKAARIAISHPDITSQVDLVERIAKQLLKGGLHERAGDLYEKIDQNQNALNCFRQGRAFRRAVELARFVFPAEVVQLEEEWGDYLASQQQMDAAISHYIESGKSVKAIEAAIHSRQWNKVMQIVETQEEVVAQKYYKVIAEHFSGIGELAQAERYYTRGDVPEKAVDMYIASSEWDSAHKVAVTCMKPEEVAVLYITHAQDMETKGRYREAEKLYVTVKEPDLAINMYKKLRQYDNMIRLVGMYHNDLLNDTHLHLGKELEGEGQHKGAEKHYIEGGDWKSAVNMYRIAGMWDDAFRIAKQMGGAVAAKQVAFVWSKTLGGDSAIRLLIKLAMLDQCIDYAVESCSFPFAFELCKHESSAHKLPEIYLKHAMYLEDEGKFKEAEESFIAAKRPKEAVLMYVHCQDWDSAQRIAEQWDPSSVSDVLVGQARVAFENKEYSKAETFLLRAERPELAVKFYKDSGQWEDALRLTQEYVPHKLQQVQDEYEMYLNSTSGGGRDDMLAPAKTWEANGDYSRAIDAYMKMTVLQTTDYGLLEEVWNKALELSLKFVPTKAQTVGNNVAQRLCEINRYESAGEVYLSIEKHQEAIDLFMKADKWDRARALARDLAPAYERQVEEQYVQHLKNRGKADELASVDVVAGLDLLASRGQWAKCLQTAEQQGQAVLNKYTAQYAATLLQDGQSQSALALFAQYGTPANPANFNLYRRLCNDLFQQESFSSLTSFKVWGMLRDVLSTLVEKVPGNKEFNELLQCAHYLSVRTSCAGHKQLTEIGVKAAISLLRYTHLITPDKAFYEAGAACRSIEWNNMAFVFFNRFLDICDAIEDGSTDMLDHSDFADTDIPYDISLPEEQSISDDDKEEAKEWVLAVSMDQRVQQELNTDERGCYEASLLNVHSNVYSPPCVLTGYPVLRGEVVFKASKQVANKDDWNVYVMARKVSHSVECQDVLAYLQLSCGAPANPSYAFH